jgi:large subunit ribosomal protein L15
MNLSNLKPKRGANRKRKRVGIGPGSGHGGTSTRGHKGIRARSGGRVRPGFEGGQMPLTRRIPKRGFTRVEREPYQVVNVGDLNALAARGPITAETLHDHGLIRHAKRKVKVLADGECTEKIQIRVDAASGAARAKIEEKGGTVEIIAVPVRPKRYRKAGPKPEGTAR